MPARLRIPQHGRKTKKLPIMFRMTPEEGVSLKLIPHAFLKAIAEGRGDEDAFLTVVFRTLVGASLTRDCTDESKRVLEADFDKAFAALVSIGKRFANTQRVGVAGDELAALRNALVLTDELQDVTTRRTQAEVYRYIQAFVGGFDHTMNNLLTFVSERERITGTAAAPLLH
jgi:hypothetical protein